MFGTVRRGPAWHVECLESREPAGSSTTVAVVALRRITMQDDPLLAATAVRHAISFDVLHVF
jgi:hypothetical protein